MVFTFGKHKGIHFFIFIGFIINMMSIVSAVSQYSQCLLPIAAIDRYNVDCLQLTDIGAFGLVRKARPEIPKHLHTGIDIKRTNGNYEDEPIFPILPGRVVSLRCDGPYAQLIIEHFIPGEGTIWTVYEHIAGIKVTLGDEVDPNQPIARFMNTRELNHYGWQFDHFHFEILKTTPRSLKPTAQHPFRRYGTYNVECFSKTDLYRYYFDPIEFLKRRLRKCQKFHEKMKNIICLDQVSLYLNVNGKQNR